MSSSNTGNTDLRETEVQQPKVTATFWFWIRSRAFSANSGQFEAGSTTTGSSLRPSTPPASLISSMVINATSLSDVSLIAIVPDSECRMPILIGPLSSDRRGRCGRRGRRRAGRWSGWRGAAAQRACERQDGNERAG